MKERLGELLSQWICWREYVMRRLDQIQHDQNRILTKEAQMAETIDSLNAKVDGIVTHLTQIAADIQVLKDQIGAGSPVTQEQLDALGAKLQGALDQSTTVDDSVP